MNAASQNLTPVTLELGGKSPAVIAPGYPIDQAVQRVLVGKFLNAGQTCIAPDYALVPRANVTAFVESAKRQAHEMYPAGLDDTDYCSIVNARQYSVSPATWSRRAAPVPQSCRCSAARNATTPSIAWHRPL